MEFALSDEQRSLEEAGATLGRSCRGASPARSGEDWRKVDAKAVLRSVGRLGAAIFLDAYAAARGSLRSARAHAEDTLAEAPEVFEAVLLAGGVEGLLQEVVENLRLPAETRPPSLPGARDPAVRRAIADARAWSALARHQARRAAWLVEVGTPSGEVASAPGIALAGSVEAVLKAWPALSPLVIGEEAYASFEADLFRPAAARRAASLSAVAERLLGPVARGERRG